MSRALKRSLLTLGLVVGMGATGVQDHGVAQAADSQGPLYAQLSAKDDARIDDPENEVAEMVEELDRLKQHLQTLQRDYQQNGGRNIGINLKKRYDEAVYAYLVEDYSRSALLFYTLQDRATSEFPDYEKVQWYLAESLFLAENYHPALEYYTRIVKESGQRPEGNKHEFYVPAVVRMVECYGLTGDAEKFESYYRMHMSGQGAIRSTPKIEYALGKTLYLRGDIDRARPIFQSLADGDGSYAPLAEYFLAAAHVSQNELDEAIQVFERLLGRSVNTPEQREVEDLAFLGLGRIYLEQGQFAKAIESYQNISRYSTHFSEALYEMSSTYYRMGDVEQSLRTLEILLLTEPDSMEAPELKLRRGMLQQEMREHNEALDTYELLIAEYSSIRDDLEGLLQEPEKVLDYFNELVGTDLSRIDSGLLVPTQAIQFALEDKAMKRAVQVSKVIREEHEDLREADHLIRDIEEIINVDDPRDLVLHVKRIRMEVRRLRDALLVNTEKLVLAEFSYIESNASGSASKQVKAVAPVIDALPQLGRELPELERDRGELMQVYEAQLDEVERNVYKLERLVEDLIAQSASVEKYLSYTREEQGIDPDTEQSTRLRLGQERVELEAALEELGEILDELGTLKFQEMLERETISREELFRRDALARIRKAEKEVAALRPLVTKGGAQEFYAQIDGVRGGSSQLLDEVNQIFHTLDSLELQEVERIRKELNIEKSRLTEYADMIRSYDDEAREISEAIAFASFSSIQSHFSDLILNANVGIIDVFWEQKEAKSSEIDQLQDERLDGIRLLQDKFSALQANE